MSDFWNYFTKCKDCNKIITIRGSSTTCFMGHLEGVHNKSLKRSADQNDNDDHETSAPSPKNTYSILEYVKLETVEEV